jgi:hypothetical protein
MIYEGTSEILEMTIARDRWQLHLKSRGGHYRAAASALHALHQKNPSVGADAAALAHECLAAVLDACQAGRLTRNQHVLFRLGELIAWTETSAAAARRAAAAAEGTAHEKTDRRFGSAAAEILAVISRTFAREAALKVADDGLRWVAGAAEGTSAQVAALTAQLPLDAVRAAQTGLLADMNAVAAAIYGRD